MGHADNLQRTGVGGTGATGDSGSTTQPLVPIEPKLPPIVGLARVGMIRAKERPRGTVADRLDWDQYVAKADLPTIVCCRISMTRRGMALGGARCTPPYTSRWERWVA